MWRGWWSGWTGCLLAIELAAARAEALGVSQLLDRLGLLAGGDRLAAGRHRSLAAAAQWSYQLLADQEQRVNRPGFCGGSRSTGEWDDGSSTEVSGRAA